MIEIVQEAIDKVEHLVADVKDELGVFSHSLALNLQHDLEVAKADVIAAGKAALGEGLQVIRQHVTDFWMTVKTAVVNQWNTLGGTFEEKVKAMLAYLKNINWAGVGSSLVAVSESTLMTAGRAAAGMFVSGLLASV